MMRTTCLALASLACAAVVCVRGAAPASAAFAALSAVRDPTIAAAGDIACDQTSGLVIFFNHIFGGCKMGDTARLVERGRFDAVLALGDLQYRDGSLAQFYSAYAKTWGAFDRITRPTPGNHEYNTQGAAGYFSYFGRGRAGDPNRGYYSFDLGQWHLISLNGNCRPIGGCGAGSPEERWLRADLARDRANCTLAYWHQPRFSSGGHHSDPAYQPFWTDLYAEGADVVLGGHDHDYERFAPQSPSGVLDRVRGIREFVVGSGGKSHDRFRAPEPNSQVRDSGSFGILAMTLHAHGYQWRFESIPGDSLADHGSGACHGHRTTSRDNPFMARRRREP